MPNVVGKCCSWAFRREFPLFALSKGINVTFSIGLASIYGFAPTFSYIQSKKIQQKHKLGLSPYIILRHFSLDLKLCNRNVIA